MLTIETANSSLLSSLNKTTNFEFCSAKDPENCSDLEGPFSKGATVWPAVALLLVGSFFRGLGYTSLVVVGLPFMDDNTSKKKSPLYIR